jgi:hypothetical protein
MPYADEVMLKLKFSDYDGPTGLYVATGKEILPMDSIAGKIALAGAGMQAGIGDPRVAEELQHEIDEAVEKAKGLQPVRVSRG